MRQSRKIELLEVDFTTNEEFIEVEFISKKNKYCILSFLRNEFEKWLVDKDYLNIDYEQYNPVTDSFTTIAYTITKEDFFSDSDNDRYRQMLIKEFIEEAI